MGLMGMLVERPLLEGRSKLSQEGGQRFKVVARNGNEIDTMFVQQRTRLSFLRSIHDLTQMKIKTLS